MIPSPLPAALTERVRRGEPQALRQFFEDIICRPNRITWRYTASRPDWYAQPRRRSISVPPPCDLVHLFIGLHEVGHILVGSSGDVLEDERRAWVRARNLLPFDLTLAQFEELRRCLRTYRRGTTAPEATKAAVDRLLGSAYAVAAQTLARLNADLRASRLTLAYLELERVEAQLR